MNKNKNMYAALMETTAQPITPVPKVKQQEICSHWLIGSCRYGNKCKHAHPSELEGVNYRSHWLKNKYTCWHFLRGGCENTNCKFKHPEGLEGAKKRIKKRPEVFLSAEEEKDRDFPLFQGSQKNLPNLKGAWKRPPTQESSKVIAAEAQAIAQAEAKAQAKAEAEAQAKVEAQTKSQEVETDWWHDGDDEGQMERVLSNLNTEVPDSWEDDC